MSNRKADCKVGTAGQLTMRSKSDRQVRDQICFLDERCDKRFPVHGRKVAGIQRTVRCNQVHDSEQTAASMADDSSANSVNDVIDINRREDLERVRAWSNIRHLLDKETSIISLTWGRTQDLHEDRRSESIFLSAHDANDIGCTTSVWQMQRRHSLWKMTENLS
jgi:hypothetical protein